MGKPRMDSIGDIRRHGCAIPVVCVDCGRAVEYGDLGPLILRFGSGKRPEHLPWRCSACGARARDGRVLAGVWARDWLLSQPVSRGAPSRS